jgi:hypothetical protein
MWRNFKHRLGWLLFVGSIGLALYAASNGGEEVRSEEDSASLNRWDVVSLSVPSDCDVISVTTYDRNSLELKNAWIAMPSALAKLDDIQLWAKFFATISKETLPHYLADVKKTGGACEFTTLGSDGVPLEGTKLRHLDGEVSEMLALRCFGSGTDKWKAIRVSYSMDDLKNWCIKSGCSILEYQQ